MLMSNVTSDVIFTSREVNIGYYSPRMERCDWSDSFVYVNVTIGPCTILLNNFKNKNLRDLQIYLSLNILEMSFSANITNVTSFN